MHAGMQIILCSCYSTCITSKANSIQSHGNAQSLQHVLIKFVILAYVIQIIHPIHFTSYIFTLKAYYL